MDLEKAHVGEFWRGPPVVGSHSGEHLARVFLGQCGCVINYVRPRWLARQARCGSSSSISSSKAHRLATFLGLGLRNGLAIARATSIFFSFFFHASVLCSLRCGRGRLLTIVVSLLQTYETAP